MSRYRFEVATRADDADLRHVLSETPMDGRIAVSFCREPSYFDAAIVEGSFRQAVAARDCESGRVVGFGSRSVSQRFVNGMPQSVGYLSSLRLLGEHRQRTLIARGYAYFRELHSDARTQLYLTTIAAGNVAALGTLTSGRAGLPTYHPAGEYHTLTIPLTRGRNCQAAADVVIRTATAADLPKIIAFYQQYGRQRQFFPCYQESDLFTVQGLLRDLHPEDLLLAFRGNQIVGTLAAWDQHHFRQTVVHRYDTALRWTRPLYNCWARLQHKPCLPAPRQPFRYLTAALPVVADDDAHVFRQLLESLVVRHAAGPAQHLLLGLHAADPLLAVAQPYAAVTYTTHLFLVCWPDGEPLRDRLDGRVPYLELGCL